MFDTLGYAKKLEGVGFSREQAETSVKILTEIMTENLASKDDIKELRHEVNRELNNLGHKMDKLESKLKSDIIIKTGALQAASVALIVALMKLL